MKLRIDFVTNSSSSSYMCLRVNSSYNDEILRQNQLSVEELEDNREKYDWDEEIPLKGYLTASMCECSLHHIGVELAEEDLEQRTLKDLREELQILLRKEYGLYVLDRDIKFEYGEIYR